MNGVLKELMRKLDKKEVPRSKTVIEFLRTKPVARAG